MFVVFIVVVCCCFVLLNVCFCLFIDFDLLITCLMVLVATVIWLLFVVSVYAAWYLLGVCIRFIVCFLVYCGLLGGLLLLYLCFPIWFTWVCFALC